MPLDFVILLYKSVHNAVYRSLIKVLDKKLDFIKHSKTLNNTYHMEISRLDKLSYIIRRYHQKQTQKINRTMKIKLSYQS